jgi:drug/metabolite transporter (DMT)-like permease
VGNVAQKRAVSALGSFSLRKPIATIASISTSWIWLIGAFVSVLGILLQLDAYRKISIAAVQAICGFGVIALLVVARVALGERLTKREQIGALCALVALAFMVGSLTNGTTSSSARLMTTRTEIAIAVTVVVTTVVIGIVGMHSRLGGAVFGLGSGLLYGAVGLGLKGASAAFSSSSVIGGVERLVTGPIPYSVACVWVVALLLFQVGIQRSRLSIVAPISTVVSTVYVVALGTPLFDEAWPSSATRIALRVLGVVAILVALAFVLASEDRSVGKTAAAASPSPRVRGMPREGEQRRACPRPGRR